MKVWHLISNRWNSAITEYALSAARALELAGHRSVFTPLAGSPAESRALGYGLMTESVKKFSAAQLPALIRIAYDVEPDVIITYGGPETVLSKLLIGPKNARVVRFRGQALEAGHAANRLRHHVSHAHVDLILAPSGALAQEIQQRYPGKRTAGLILGCDTQRYSRRPPREASTRPLVTVLGRLDPVKGHEKIFRIFARVSEEWPGPYPRPVLNVVGEPANLSVATLEQFARDAALRLGDDVLITPTRVADVAQMLSDATLGVVPSLGSEIIARVAEEFLLCGTPIVVSGVGSLEETLFADAGASYRGQDPVAAAVLLRDWILRSLGEGEAAKARRARQAAELFSLEKMGEELAHLVGF